MKKLMILSAVVAMAMGVTAETSFKWGTTSKDSRGATGAFIGNGGAFCYARAYLYLGTATIDANNVFCTDGLTLVGSVATTATNTSVLKGSGSSDLIKAEGGQAYTIVLVSALANGNSVDIKNSVDLTGEGPFAMLVYNGVSSVDSEGKIQMYDGGKAYQKTDFTKGVSVQTIPEPTSGLLMLLGVAGLALRRKRA